MNSFSQAGCDKVKAGDLDGAATWKRIIKAVEELLSKDRPAGVTAQ